MNFESLVVFDLNKNLTISFSNLIIIGYEEIKMTYLYLLLIASLIF